MTLVIDVDDVILHHYRPLIKYLAPRGYSITYSGTSLDWVIVHQKTGHLLDQDQSDKVLEAAFEQIIRQQRVIYGALDAIEQLSSSHGVILLTNAPENLLGARMSHLKSLGLSVPIQRNTGGKGRAVEHIRTVTGSTVLFVDDSERQIRNVKKHSFGTITIRADLVGAYPHHLKRPSEADFLANDWQQIVRIVRSYP